MPTKKNIIGEVETISNANDGPATSSGYALPIDELSDYEKEHPAIGIIEPKFLAKDSRLLEAVELLQAKLDEVISKVEDLEEKITPKPQISPEKTPMRDREYVVEEGDTLALISRKVYGNPGNFKIIMGYNKLVDSSAITPGQVLKIPAIGAYA